MSKDPGPKALLQAAHHTRAVLEKGMQTIILNTTLKMWSLTFTRKDGWFLQHTTSSWGASLSLHAALSSSKCWHCIGHLSGHIIIQSWINLKHLRACRPFHETKYSLLNIALAGYTFTYRHVHKYLFRPWNLGSKKVAYITLTYTCEYSIKRSKKKPKIWVIL